MSKPEVLKKINDNHFIIMLFPNPLNVSEYIEFFRDSDILSIKDVKEWGDKYWNCYVNTKEYWNCNKCPINAGFPCLCRFPDDEYVFISVYEELDKVINYHKEEAYFETELEEYENCKNSSVNLKIWLEKNRKKYEEECALFYGTYLNYALPSESKKYLQVEYPNYFNRQIINQFRSQLGRKGVQEKYFYTHIDIIDFYFRLKFMNVFSNLLNEAVE